MARRKQVNKPTEITKKISDLGAKYPTLENVSIEYHGSGDSFEEFWNTETTPDGIDITEKDMEELLDYALEHSDADFNNDGSDGTIIIDFIKKEMSIDNYWKEMVSRPSGIKKFR